MDQICMDQNCEDCRHLWRAYAAATSDYFSVDAQLQAAAGKDNFEAVALLIPRLEASEETKAAVRNALRQHEEETGYRCPPQSTGLCFRGGRVLAFSV